jgi:hypothetical protein
MKMILCSCNPSFITGCGQGSSWDGEKCVGNLNSGGWNGEHSDGSMPGCTVRRCCEEAC